MSMLIDKRKLNYQAIDELKQNLFTVAFSLYLFDIIMAVSLFGYMDELHPVLKLLKFASYILILAKLVLDFSTDEFSKKELLIVATVSGVLVLRLLLTKERDLLAYWGFIIAARNVDFDKVIKISLIVHVICLVLIILSSYVGIIDNRLYYRNKSEQTGLRESLGFGYTAEGAHMLFYTTMMWLYYRRDKIRPAEWLILIAVNLFIFAKTDTKNPMALALIGVLGSIVLKYSKQLRKYHSWYTVIAVCIIPVLMTFIISAAYNYNAGNEIFKRLNKFVNGRLDLGHTAINYCGISLLGKTIDYGFQPDGGPLIWLDSSYLTILVSYGIITLLMIALAAVAFGFKIGKRHDTYMVLIISLIAIHSTFDAMFLLLEYNSFIMIYSYFKKDKIYETQEARV